MTRTAASPFDYSRRDESVRLVRVRLRKMIPPGRFVFSQDFEMRSDDPAGQVLADWQTGDFGTIETMNDFGRGGNFSYDVTVTFKDMPEGVLLWNFLKKKLCNKRLEMELTDSCGTVRRLPNMKFREGNGKQADTVNLNDIQLTFGRVNASLQTESLETDALLQPIVVCELLPGGGEPISGGDPNGGNIPEPGSGGGNNVARLISIVECVID